MSSEFLVPGSSFLLGVNGTLLNQELGTRNWELGPVGRLATQLTIAVSGMLLVAVVLASFALKSVVAEVPDYGGAYVEGLPGFPQALNPILANDDASHAVNALVFSGLTKTDEKGQAVADLAESWSLSADGKVYTFVLRNNARWHDGTPVTADDAVFTFKLLQDPAYTGQLGAVWKDVGVEKVDERTVKLMLQKDSFAPFLEYTTLGLLPAHVLQDVHPRDLPSHRFNVQPIGTGPFRVKEVRPDQIMLEASPHWYGPRPYLSRVLFRIYPNYKTILTALERHEVEGVPLVDPQDASRVATDKRVTLYDAPQASLTLLFFNVANPILADRAVRQSIAYAINKERLIEIGRSGRARRADSPVLPGSWAYSPDQRRYDFDPAKAREVLEAAGWKVDQAEGADGRVRVKDGKRLRLVLLTNDRRERIRLAEEIQQQLTAVGFEVEVQATGAGGLVQDFLLPRRFELALYSWDFNGFDPDPYALWHSSQLAPQGLNIAGYVSRKADDLLEKGRRSTDQAERTRLYVEFQQTFAEDLPSLPLYYPTYEFAISAKIKGVRPGVVAGPADRFRNVVEWYAKTRREVIGRR
ncbi:MAG: peptide ABC transporter substrate-binding protein [Chloroflexi bacterium]|nr:peptide ABC transporter substrate-binding protein [Chloroflexota bacterium]